jgi:hypothetical protein
MSLLALQRDFGAFLRDGDAADAAPGMRVYQNNYRAQLVACLVDSFTLTLDWIGDDAFERAVIHHIRRVPPSSWTLDAYARDFPDTLAWLHPDDPEIAELAWLELALAEAFVGSDVETLSSADAANVDWDEAILRFIPMIDMCAVTTNACDLWIALAAGEAPPTVATLDKPHALIVWRQDMVSRFRLIDAQEEQAILLARAGLSFADLCAAIVASRGEEEGVVAAGAYLGRWLADGLLDISTGEPKCT